MALLGAEFDTHPLLEYVDVSGYGFWGEMHHFARYTADGSVTNYQPGSPRQVEAIIDRLISDHLKAFQKTPAVLGLHAADYSAGQRAFEQGLCWPRRDSFQSTFSTAETRLAQGLKPGGAMLWETILPGISCPSDTQPAASETLALPQRYFDIGAHYIAMGFNPWDALWAHEHCRDTCQILERQIGYRLRPSIVWLRRTGNNKNEIVLGLRNDGCSAPPGQITIQARFPDGSERSLALPVGEPTPGAMKMYALPHLADANKFGSNKTVDLSMSIQIKGKKSRAQWAVKNGQTADSYVLKIPLKRL